MIELLECPECKRITSHIAREERSRLFVQCMHCGGMRDESGSKMSDLFNTGDREEMAQ